MTDQLWQIMSEGAEIVSPDVLQPADVLLDLYGEDIRARAYVTQDPVLGEMMMRPDFTVPIVQTHMAGGVEPARYAYQGKVWRKQDVTTGRPREYAQIGFEVFDSANPALADAEVYVRVIEALNSVSKDMPLEVAVGDVSLMRAAVASLDISDIRKRALMRHLWRPARFNALLARFAGEVGAPQGREALPKENLESALAVAGPQIGLRSASDVARRIDRLNVDRTQADIPQNQLRALRELQALDVSLDKAVFSVSEIAADLKKLDSAVANLKSTCEALEAKHVNLRSLRFQGTYGLTAMEYYDGFVFGVSSSGVLLATGGRYDALTEVLGSGQKMAAVGAVIRPDSLAKVSS